MKGNSMEDYKITTIKDSYHEDCALLLVFDPFYFCPCLDDDDIGGEA